MNSVKMEIEGFNVKVWISYILSEEFKKLKKEFKDQLKNAPCEIKLFSRSNLISIWEDICHMQGDLSRKKLYEYFNDKQYSITYSLMQTEFGGYRDDDNKMIVDTLNILLLRDQIYSFIIENLDHLDLVMDYLRLALRHEFGHVLDYIRFNGMAYDEYREERARREKARCDYNEALDHTKGQTMDNLREYYSLEEEATANANVGISLEEKIKYDAILDKIDHTKLKTTLTITSEYEPLKEDDDSDGERK